MASLDEVLGEVEEDYDLHVACSEGDVAAAKALLPHADPQALNEGLALAAAHGHASCVELLLRSGITLELGLLCCCCRRSHHRVCLRGRAAAGGRDGRVAAGQRAGHAHDRGGEQLARGWGRHKGRQWRNVSVFFLFFFSDYFLLNRIVKKREHRVRGLALLLRHANCRGCR